MIRIILALCLVVHSSAVSAVTERPEMSEQDAREYTESLYLGDANVPWTPVGSVARSANPDFTVAQDGSGTHRTIQSALDALPRSGRPFSIAVKDGVYRELICIQDRVPFTLYGLGKAPRDVQIVYSLYAGLSSAIHQANPCITAQSPIVGTAGSSTAFLQGNQISLANLSISNDSMEGVFNGQGYPLGAGESGGAQGVALTVQGDQIHLQNVELWGHQDTFYVRRASSLRDAEPQRILFENGLVAGDVDFIFGDATLVIRNSLILSRSGRRTPPNGGHILAPSTPTNQRLGFLVSRSWLLAEAGLARKSHSLGRAWDFGVINGGYQPGISPNGQALIRDSILGPHVRPWYMSTSRRPYAADGPFANRLLEFRNVSTEGPERDILPRFGGWASLAGVVGGSMASPDRVFDIHTRRDLVQALALEGLSPRILRVHREIRMDSSETGSILTEEDFRDADFQWSAFEAAYSPKTWGMKRPQGPLEEARRRSGRHQARHVIARIPSNTTVIGMTQEAGITGGGLSIDDGENIVVRGLRFRQARDYFPQWDPSDGRAGDWNAQYDSLALRRATRVWVDGNHFSSHISEETPRTLFDRPIEHFDALLDITHRSDLITVSWNRFEEHRKVTLVGGSDRADDADALRVTFHHNHYRDVGSRAPRVRFGKVHLYNNLYTMSAGAERWFDYSIGLGKESQVLMQSNAWEIPKDIPLNRLLKNWGGRVLKEVDSSVNGRSVQLKAAIELDQQVSFDSEATFFPPYRFRLEPSASLRDVITRGAGSTLN
ncbi:MAG: hypothetical protein RLY30_475 [Pseudomonadota bacterium]